ncbi:MAG TPA: hypothetical protein V6C78_32230 [Crinalium sp.]|jgi:hypothetical protein
MSAKPYKTIGAGAGIGNLQVFSQGTSRIQTNAVRREAERIEDLLRKLLYSRTDLEDGWDVYTHDYQKLRNLNSFGKQVAMQMLRSNPAFQGFRVEFKDPALKPDALFLVGTLCNDFDHMNTSPLYGINVLDVGCGSLSPYGNAKDKDSLVEQFFSDQPPIATELLQILGAHTVGIDPRHPSREVYDYQTTYKHRTMDFSDISKWLTTLDYCFDVVSCLNLFDKSNFAYYYSLPEDLSRFLKLLRRAMSPKGLLYCTHPFLPSSEENQQTNRQIFNEAGFDILHEGYYVILQVQ